MKNNKKINPQHTIGFYEKHIKRLLDVILALLGIVVLLPVLLIVATLIKVKLGSPIFFRQPRPGKNEKIFYLVKFRSMSDSRNENGDLLPDNMRLTKFGKFLRKSSLDELPELINILKGEMSFIGPRPLSIFYLPYYSTEERKRHSVRPGLTGLAQINGRNASSWDEKLKYDSKYVNEITCIKDLKIFFETIAKVIKQSDVAVRNDDPLKNFNVWKKVKEESNMSIVEEHSEEVGSDFDLVNPISDSSQSIHEFLTSGNFDDYQYTFSGRGAIAQVLEDILIDKDINVAYLPSYSCVSMLQPFLDKNITIKFYDVIIEKGSFHYIFDDNVECDLVLFMEYFGFNTCNQNVKKSLEKMQSKGATVVQDITHSLFNNTHFDFVSDYQVASIRKWCAIPSGGIAYKMKDNFNSKVNEDSNLAVKNKLLAMDLKKEYLKGNLKEKKDFLKINADFNNSLIRLSKDLKIDDYSKNYLESTSTSFITKYRKENALYIYNNLKNDSLFFFPFNSEELKSVVPLFVPIIFKDLHRDEIRQTLIENQIYLPVHWPEEFGANSSIKEKELSIVCDQRYTTNDLTKMIDIINDWKK